MLVLAWMAGLDEGNARFGSLAGPADVNADGYADLVVGAGQYGFPDAGAVFSYLGAADAVAVLPTVSLAPDVGGLGGSLGVGDVDGDGFDDVAAGAPAYTDGSTLEGVVFLYPGSVLGLPVNPTWWGECDTKFAELGSAVRADGDFNGDGFADVLGGAPNYQDAGVGQGGAFVFPGSPAGPSVAYTWSAEGKKNGVSNFGTSVAASDVDGDGFDDLLVGAPGYDGGQTDEGSVFLYPGSALGPSAAATWSIESDRKQTLVGSSLASAGDVDGDGYDDVVVGARFYSGPGAFAAGAVLLFTGSAGGLPGAPVWFLEGPPNSELGGSVAGAGDVDGDGYADLVAGAWIASHGDFEEGLVWFFYGSAGGPPATPSWSFEPDVSLAEAGTAVAGAGDVNGDGLADVAFGAPGYPLGGKAFVYSAACPVAHDLVDLDRDGVPGLCDICPWSDDNLDTDADGVPDGCDDCPSATNRDQLDDDGDGLGNACDHELDATVDVTRPDTPQHEQVPDEQVDTGVGRAPAAHGRGCGCDHIPSAGAGWMAAALLFAGRFRRRAVPGEPHG